MRAYSREFDFSPLQPADGLAAWRTEREAAQRALARRVGLPLGKPAEVRLKSGIILRGAIRIPELLPTDTVTRFQIDGHLFTIQELESCVRL